MKKRINFKALSIAGLIGIILVIIFHIKTIDEISYTDFIPVFSVLLVLVYSIANTGLIDLWRGSALSRPLLDAILTPDKKYLVALHRGDSFINLDSQNNRTRIETYQWNGFGFSGFKDSETMEYAIKYYDSRQNIKQHYLPGLICCLSASPFEKAELINRDNSCLSTGIRYFNK